MQNKIIEIDVLTATENRVYCLNGVGKQIKEIADLMKSSYETTKFHMKNIKTKLNLQKDKEVTAHFWCSLAEKDFSQIKKQIISSCLLLLFLSFIPFERIQMRENRVNECRARRTIIARIPNSKVNITSSNYGFGGRSGIYLQQGETYTFSINGRIDQQALDDGKRLRVYLLAVNDSGTWIWNTYVDIDSLTDITKAVTFKNNLANEQEIRLTAYMYPSGGSRLGKVTLNWYKLEKGNKPTDWTPSADDIPDIVGSTLTLEENRISLASKTIELTGETLADAIKTKTLNVGDKFSVDTEGNLNANNANIGGTINAASGTIGGSIYGVGGFKIGSTRIYKESGTTPSVMNLSDKDILFQNVSNYAYIGVPSLSGLDPFARFKMDRSPSASSSGNVLFTQAKFPNDGQDHVYQRRSIWNDGNLFSVGGHALFNDKYIGQAMFDVISSLIEKTHVFFFNSVPQALTIVDLPNRAKIDGINGVDSRITTFFLHIQIGWLGNGNQVRISGVENGYLLDNDGNRPNGGYGYLNLGQCDCLTLIYHSGNYIITQYRT